MSGEKSEAARADVDRAAKLLKMRGTGDAVRRLAVERKIRQLPHDAVQRARRQAGPTPENRAIGRVLGQSARKHGSTTSGPGQAAQRRREDTPAPTVGQQELRNRAGELFSVVQAAYTEFNTNYLTWVAAADAFGSCYKDAYEQFEEVRKKQERADKLVADIAFGVLIACTAGALASLSAIAKDQEFFKEMKEWQSEGIREALKEGASKLTEGIAEPKEESYSVSTDPLTFYLGLKNAVDQHAKSNAVYLNNLVQAAKDYTIEKRPLDDLKRTDPAEIDRKLQEWKRGQRLFHLAPEVPKEALTREIEIGLWAKWVQGLTHIHEIIGKGEPVEKTEYSDPGRFIERRMKDLKIASLPKLDWGTLWMSDDEIEKLITWGKNWTPEHRFVLGN
jgi:hypothetical protein